MEEKKGKINVETIIGKKKKRNRQQTIAYGCYAPHEPPLEYERETTHARSTRNAKLEITAPVEL